MDDRETAALEVEGLKKSYNGRVVLDIDSLSVQRGEVLVVLGESGAGKSVFLRLLNLLEVPSEGKIFFSGKEIQNLSGKSRVKTARRMAMIFQDPILFRGSVFDNVSYGLKVRGVSSQERRLKVIDALELVGLSGFERRSALTLSGGEAQRVALAAAIVLNPELLLLDEPFENLDAPARRRLQEDVRSIFHQNQMTAVFVTHDQVEAARMGDRIAVLQEGKIVQVGEANQIFFKPGSKFIAKFVGFENMLDGVVIASKDGLSIVDVRGVKLEVTGALNSGGRVTLCLRPEDITIFQAGRNQFVSSSRNCIHAVVRQIDSLGPTAKVYLSCPFPLIALLTRRSIDELGITPGARCFAGFKATAVHVFEENA